MTGLPASRSLATGNQARVDGTTYADWRALSDNDCSLTTRDCIFGAWQCLEILNEPSNKRLASKSF